MDSRNSTISDAGRAQQTVYGLSLIAGPLLLGISTVFWKNGETGMVGGAIAVLSAVFWIVGLFGLFNLVRERMPRYAAFGSLVAAYACMGFDNFGMEGIYLEVFRALGGREISVEGSRAAMGGVLPVVLLTPGLLFPVSIVVLGIVLWRTGAVPAWCGIMLSVGAASFPAGRIPRIEAIAHTTDLLLCIPAAWIGLRYLRGDAMPSRSELGFSTTR
jgi:hypothetical protein